MQNNDQYNSFSLVKFVFKDMSLSQPFVKNGKE